MRYLAAEIIIDGNLMKGVVVDVSPEGKLLSVTPLADLPCEPANTRYVDHLEASHGLLNSASTTAVATLTFSDSDVSASAG